MNQQEEEKIKECVLRLFDLNNKALFLAKSECPGSVAIKKLTGEISNFGFQCFNDLDSLIQKPKSGGMSADRFVHSPIMGG